MPEVLRDQLTLIALYQSAQPGISREARRYWLGQALRYQFKVV